jgi:hypothetical protein
MHETSRKMIRAEFVTCVEEAPIPHKIVLTNEEKRLLRRSQNGEIQVFGLEGCGLASSSSGQGPIFLK